MIKPGFLAPKGALDNKPPHGSPCNRCGLCCVATLCPLARAVFGGESDSGRVLGPCPALGKDADGLAVCGLAAEPEKYRPTKAAIHGKAKLRDAALHLIGAGDGCDARFNGEPINHEFNAQLERSKDPRATRKARRAWGVHNAPDDFGNF